MTRRRKLIVVYVCSIIIYDRFSIISDVIGFIINAIITSLCFFMVASSRSKRGPSKTVHNPVTKK